VQFDLIKELPLAKVLVKQSLLFDLKSGSIIGSEKSE
jgi:hypothetical protein